MTNKILAIFFEKGVGRKIVFLCLLYTRQL